MERPSDAESWIELGDQLERQGDFTSAAGAWLAGLQRTGARKLLSRVGRRLTRIGHADAASAWRLLAARDPYREDARTQLEELELYGPGEGPNSKPRILVVGNCQAYSLGAHLRRMCPDVEIRTVGLAEADNSNEAAAMAARWSRLDLVITQPVVAERFGALCSHNLERRAARIAYFPRIHFCGFHPDLMRTGVPPLRSFPIPGFHSAIVMSAFAMGLPEDRVPDLFNAYVYGVLGYFDEYAKSELHLRNEIGRLGFDFEGVLSEWKRLGVFLHLPGHPTAAAFAILAQRLAKEFGLKSDLDPKSVDDRLQYSGKWPVYPEIARRLGVQGGMTFNLGLAAPSLDLKEFVARSYRAYAEVSPEALHTVVARTIATLRSVGH